MTHERLPLERATPDQLTERDSGHLGAAEVELQAPAKS